MPFEEGNQPKSSLIAALARRINNWITNEPQGRKAALVFWLAGHLPHCKQIAPLMSEAMDHELPLRARIKVKLHLIVCLACVRYEQQLHFLSETAQKLAAHIEERQASGAGLSDEARARLKRVLSDKRE